MRTLRNINTVKEAHWVGNGFPVSTMFSYHREAEALSPFLLLDYAGPVVFGPAQIPRGVGKHPHRGFETVTIVYQGELAHRDSTGQGGVIGPGITAELLQAGSEGDIPLIPGVATISELMQAKAAGYDHLKFFPAEAAGGCAMLKSIAGPFPNIKFCPTGGIHQNNFQDYLALPNVSCVGGSWILPKDAIAAGDWQRVQKLAERAVAAAK